jgi:hypothetical protein
MRRQKFTGDGRRPYREAGCRAGVAPDKLRVGINGHGFLADAPEAAVDAFFGPYDASLRRPS